MLLELPRIDARPVSSAPAMIVDSFAGGGGASTGIEAALGCPITVAINHDPEAVAMHLANHPDTLHYCQSVWAADPLEVVRDPATGLPRRVQLAWFSPDCKHFSKAKGGKPVEKHIRDLAWIVVEWAERVGPDVIMLENVEEFKTWAPLGPDNRPVRPGQPVAVDAPLSLALEAAEPQPSPQPARKGRKRTAAPHGETFEAWVSALRRLDYKIEWRELRACDYGAPTSRKRLYLIARRDGVRITWPRPTHGKPGSPEVLTGERLPWRTAAECIDFSIQCPSIFDRMRPLKEATNRRIAHGVVRYVIERKPFIVGTAFTNTRASRVFDPQDPLRTTTSQPEYGLVNAGVFPLTHHGAHRFYSAGEPFVTITGAHRGELATVGATIVPVTHSQGGNRARSAAEPLRTITTAKGGELAGVTVTLAPFVPVFRNNMVGSPVDDPMRTVTANGNPARPAGAQPLAYAEAVLAPLFVRTAHGEQDKSGKKRGRGSHEVTETFPTVTASQDSALLGAVLAPLVVGCGGRRGQSGPVDLKTPYPTITAKNDACLVGATMVQMGYGERAGQRPRALDLVAPLGTIVAGGAKHGLVTAHLEKFSENSRGRPVDQPFDTVMAGAPRFGQVSAFLTHFYTSNTNGGQGDPAKPVKTVTAGGQHHGIVCAHMEQANTGLVGHDMREPVSTIVGKGCTQRPIQTTLIAADALPADMMDRAVKVAAFLIKYYGNEDDGHGLAKPIGTVTTKDRFAVVTVTIDAVTYVIVDIGMRMLTPRELANAQGFPSSYVLDPIGPNGKPLTKSAQIRMIGNSVCPAMSEALVRANLPDLCVDRPAEAVAA